MKVVVVNFLNVRCVLVILRFFQIILSGQTEMARGFTLGDLRGDILRNAASAAFWVLNSNEHRRKKLAIKLSMSDLGLLHLRHKPLRLRPQPFNRVDLLANQRNLSEAVGRAILLLQPLR